MTNNTHYMTNMNMQRPPLPGNMTMKINDIYHVYGIQGATKVVALKGVSLELNKAEILGIIGPSGAGKSTLLLSLGGMLKPTAGEIIFSDGTDITKLPEEMLFSFRRYNVGYVFQEGNLINYLTARENIEMPMKLINKPLAERRKRSQDLMERLGIWHRKDHQPTRLSGGERQRVAICRALANEPAIILADEPTGAVDAETSQTILELFKELKDETGTSYLLCSHDPIVGEFSDRTLEIQDGLILGQHGLDLDFMDLDSSRILVLDQQNRLPLPEKLTMQFEGHKLFSWKVEENQIILQPLHKEEEKKKYPKFCPSCGYQIPKGTFHCPRCGTNLVKKIR